MSKAAVARVTLFEARRTNGESSAAGDQPCEAGFHLTATDSAGVSRD